MTCNTSAVAVSRCSASSRSASLVKLSLTLGKLTSQIGYELLGIG